MRFFMCILIFLVNSSFCRAERLVFACEDKDIFPSHLGNTTQVLSEKPGLSIDLLTQVGKELGIEIVFERMPWNRCKIMVERGAVDGIFDASYNLERLALGYYPTKDFTHKGPVNEEARITTMRYMFYVPRNGSLAWDGKMVYNPSGKGVAAILGYSITNNLKDFGLEVTEVRNMRTALNMLQAGRVSGYADLESKVDKVLFESPRDAQLVKKLPIPVKEKHYYLLLSKKFVESKPTLARSIWATIRKIRDSAQYAEMKKKYYTAKRPDISKKVIRMAAVEWMPYVSVVNPEQGFMSKLLIVIFKRMGYEVVIENVPWKRGLQETIEGKYHGIFPTYITAQRDADYAMSDSFGESPIGFLKLKSKDIKFESMSDLRGYTIGAVRGYVNTKAFDEADYLTRELVNSEIQNLGKLLKDRIDLTILDHHVARHIIQQKFPAQRGLFEIVTPALERKSLHVAFSKNIRGYEKIVEQFNQELARALEDGTVGHIIPQNSSKDKE